MQSDKENINLKRKGIIILYITYIPFTYSFVFIRVITSTRI